MSVVRFLLIPVLALSLALPVWAAPNLPELGDPAGGLLSPEQESRMGQAWLRQMRGQVSMLQDPQVQEYSEQLVYRLASHSDLKNPDLTVVVLNKKAINAFAVPGGIIGLNAGLFLYAGSEDELGAVIAHELGHLSQHHFARSYANHKHLSRATLAALLASIAVAISGDAQAGMAGIAATQAASIQSQLAYSRGHEREADRIGMQTLARAGMNPEAMPNFFERMLRMEQYGGQPPEFLLTHPLTEQRVADTRARADQLPHPPLHASLSFLLIQARVRSAFIADPDDAVKWFSQQYEGKDSLHQQAAGYGLALALIRARDFDRAAKILKALRKESPNEMRYMMAQAELQRARGDTKAAIATLDQVLEVMPGNYPASMMQAHALLDAGEPAKAATLLDPLTQSRPRDPLVWNLLAEARGRSGEKARAHRCRGEYLFLTGREDQGVEQLHYALDGSKDNFSLHSRVKARLDQMHKLMREEKQDS